VATMPSKAVSLIISIMSSNWENDRSGAIFKSIGFLDGLVLFISCNLLSINFKGFFSCNSLKPGVLGELTLTTK